jgi:hypothetical protein
VIDGLAFVAVTVIGGYLLLAIVTINTLIYVKYKDYGKTPQKPDGKDHTPDGKDDKTTVPDFLNKTLQHELANTLLMLVQLIEDLDSMLLEAVHFAAEVKHHFTTAAALWEDVQTAMKKTDRILYLIGLLGQAIQIVSSVVATAITLHELEEEVSHELAGGHHH